MVEKYSAIFIFRTLFRELCSKKTDNSLELLIDEKPEEIEDIRGTLESYIQKNLSFIRTVSRKKFKIAIECSSASNLLVVERDLTRLMSEKNGK